MNTRSTEIAELGAATGATHLTPAGQGEGWSLFRCRWQGRDAALKHYSAVGDELPLFRPVYRAASEAEGLRLFSPRHVAPELFVAGETNSMESYIVRSWLEGDTLGSGLTQSDAVRYAATLGEIHTSGEALARPSLAPRNLERWWNRTHVKYRDLPDSLRADLHGAVDGEISRIAQPVAADCQAHKRFWDSAPAVPVCGDHSLKNAIRNGEKIALLDWQYEGMGDAAYEVVSASLSVALALQEKENYFSDLYLEGSDEPTLPWRVQIYTRVLPFEYLVDALLAAWEHRAITTAEPAGAATFWLRLLLDNYGTEEITAVEACAELEAWLANVREGGVAGDA